MNRLELVNTISRKMGATKKDADKAVTAFIDTVTEALVEGRKVQLIGFGTFEVRERAARKGRNPQQEKKSKFLQAKFQHLKLEKA